MRQAHHCPSDNHERGGETDHDNEVCEEPQGACREQVCIKRLYS